MSDAIICGMISKDFRHVRAWVFDLETGVARGADEGAVATYPVRVDAGRVLIDAQRLVGRRVA